MYVFVLLYLQIFGSLDAKVKFTLNVIKGGGPKSQFKFLEMGGCLKNDGQSCDGDPTTDVSRLVRMILNPNTTAKCSPTNLQACPLYHGLGVVEPRVYRSDTASFPYEAYHSYCAPANAKLLEEPYEVCDPYSSLTQQEILTILPHPIWAKYGFPAKKGDGWIGDSRSWDLNVGMFWYNLFFDQVTHPI